MAPSNERDEGGKGDEGGKDINNETPPPIEKTPVGILEKEKGIYYFKTFLIFINNPIYLKSFTS